MRDVIKHNRTAWDRESEKCNPATVPYSDAQLQAAKAKSIDLSLTGGKLVPRTWYEPLAETRVLCVALGGGQQVPLIAAAGAKVVSVDNSQRQLASDQACADRNGLRLETVLGDMRKLPKLVERNFDLAVLGLGTQFLPDPTPVWEGLFHSLRSGGRLIGAIVNPVAYSFEWPDYEQGIFRVKYPLPYSDVSSLTEAERVQKFHEDDPIEFGHTLEQSIGGITAAGFLINGFMEDHAADDPLSRFLATYFVISAVKP